MSSKGLLIFTKNELISEPILKLHKTVDQILVIDFTTDSEIFQKNKKLADEIGFEIIKIVDIGYIEIYREYAFKKMQTDYIINLDPDETPSDGFVSGIRELDNFDIAYVPRKVSNDVYYEYIPRIFRRNSVTWRGYIHETPLIKKTNTSNILYLNNNYIIFHNIDEANWNDEKNRKNRFLELEALIRPPIMHCFLNTYNFQFPERIKILLCNFQCYRPLNKIVLRFVFLNYLIKQKITKPNVYKFSYFYYKYNMMKLSYFYRLSQRDQTNYINMYLEAYENGGPIKYLNFDDVAYVESLKNDDSLAKGAKGLLSLLMFRSATGGIYHES